MNLLQDAIQDLRYGARTLLRTPAFTALAVLIVALGVGANSAVFSVVDRALLAPLPFDRPDDLFTMYQKTAMTPRFSVSYLNYLDWRKQNQTFVDVAACRTEDVILSSGGQAENVHAAMISAELFPTLGLHSVLGRAFEAEDDRLGAGRVVLLDEDFWRERYGGSPAAGGAVLRFQGSAYTLAGIAPRALHALGRFVGPAKLYLPLGQWDEASFRDRQVTTGMHVIARRKSGVAAESARADLDRVAANLAAAYPDADRDIGITLEGLKETLVFRVRTTLLALLAAVALVWLIACADVANLALVRSAGRAREFATRTALGSGVARLIRQLLAETVLLAAAGGCGGIALSWIAAKYV